MFRSFFLLSFLTVILLADAAPSNGSGADAAGGKNAKAVYFLTNEAKNSIVALKVNPDGTLSEGSITSTGGSGATGLNGLANNTAAGPDALFSQSALKVESNVSLSLAVSTENHD